MTIENALVDRGYRGRKWIGDTMMAAAGFNLKHLLNKVILVFNLIYRILIAELLNILQKAGTG